jgi:putative ABC transport system ATP-binding protein
MLTVENLSHQYTTDDKPLYEDVNLKFEPGTMYSIVGESGSGKTTLLSFIAGLDTPKVGSIDLNGKSIKSIGLDKYRNRDVSIIFQAYNLMNYMSAFQNVKMALEITRSKNAGDKQYIETSLNKLGLQNELLNKNVQKLSGGQQQRVAVARALAVDAKIILADEPTGNLDAENTKEIISIFKEIAHKEGKTVIIVTHDSKVAKAADVQIKIQNRQVKIV